jgi:hypothetical protein
VEEKDWLVATDPTQMLEFIEPRASDRKLFLLSVACKRIMWKLRGKEAQAYETLEAVADMPNPASEFDAFLEEFDRYWGIGMSPWEMAELRACGPRVAIGRQHGPPLIREIFGNPFRPVALDDAWLTSDVLELARTIYRDHVFDRMPILADALQEAG